VWVRPAGENIVICPPYIVEDAHIDQIVQTVADSIRRNA
jgi:beta-alanine--pyruvate transaminase